MPKLIEFFESESIKKDWKTLYIRYRLGRLKHQYWLWNRKHKDRALIDEYDYAILQNCKPGKTVFFSSAGYYLKDIFSDIIVVEQFEIVKSFYKDVYICQNRKDLPSVLNFKIDNFAVVNNRADMWVDADGLTNHLKDYMQVLNLDARIFYSFRDTQIIVNRLTTNLYEYFLNWALSLEESLGLKLVWHDIQFPKKVPDNNGNYDLLENPDTTNGNLKFWFVYKGKPWTIV